MQTKSANADEIKSTNRHSYFIRPQGGFHRQKRFIPLARVDLAEKTTAFCQNRGLFMVHRKGLEPPTLGTGIRCSIH